MYNIQKTLQTQQQYVKLINPLDAGRRLTDFSQTSYAAGSRLTYKTVNQRSGS